MKAFRLLEKNPLRCQLAPGSAFRGRDAPDYLREIPNILYRGRRNGIVLRVKRGTQDYVKSETNNDTDK